MTGHVCGGVDVILDAYNLPVTEISTGFMTWFMLICSRQKSRPLHIITLSHKHPQRAICQHFERLKACVV